MWEKFKAAIFIVGRSHENNVHWVSHSLQLQLSLPQSPSGCPKVCLSPCWIWFGSFYHLVKFKHLIFFFLTRFLFYHFKPWEKLLPPVHLHLPGLWHWSKKLLFEIHLLQLLLISQTACKVILFSGCFSRERASRSQCETCEIGRYAS